MNLYPYQQKIVDEVLSNFKRVNKQMIVVPTGGGKTVIFCRIAQILGLKTIVLAHTKELVYQCQKTARMMHVEDMDVTTVQSVSRRTDALGAYDLLIVDECHRGGSKSYLKCINEFKEKKVIGVTATPFRTDQTKLLEIFGEKIQPLTLLDMINADLLCDFEGFRVRTNVSLRGISTKNGDFSADKLASVINVKNRNELIVREFKNLAQGLKTLCFAASLKHGEELVKEFQKAGISCASCHGELPKKARKQILLDFKTDKIQVLINCQLLTEGFDEPSIRCLLMARPTQSKILYTQMIGRGARKFPDKKICKVIEFTDNDYDVSSLEDLISPLAIRKPIQQGETLSRYGSRIKEFLEECNQTFVDSMVVVPKSIYEKGATPWQRSFLLKTKIKHQEPLTEFVANQLIVQAVNGIN